MEKGTPGFNPHIKTKPSKKLTITIKTTPSPALNRKKLLPRNLTILEKGTGTSSLAVSYKVKDNLLGDSAFLKIFPREEIISCYTPEEMSIEL